jgi:predicted Na+-dependent transporter
MFSGLHAQDLSNLTLGELLSCDICKLRNYGLLLFGNGLLNGTAFWDFTWMVMLPFGQGSLPYTCVLNSVDDNTSLTACPDQFSLLMICRIDFNRMDRKVLAVVVAS